MKQDRTLKCWLTGFIITAVAALALIAGLVVFVDPFFCYHERLEGFPYQIDEQMSQNPGMARHFPYDSVLLGSSMTVNFEADWFEELMGDRLIKLPYNGAYPRDISNIMEQVDRGGNRLKRVYLGVDLASYTDDTDVTKYPIPDYIYTASFIDDVSYWYNKDVLLDYIIKPVLMHEEPTSLSSVYNSEWWMKDYYGRDKMLSTINPVENNEAYFPDDLWTDRLTANLETNILPIIDSHPDTEFVVFVPPYSVMYWYEYVQYNQINAVYQNYRTFADAMLKRDNVRLYFFADNEDICTNFDNYADAGHYRQSVNRYMAECFKADRERMTADNKEIRIQKLRELVENTDYESLAKNE